MTVSIRELLRSSLKNLYRYKYTYLLTSILLQLFIGTVGRYSLAAGFRWAMSLTGESNLTKDNIWRILNQTGPFLLLSAYLLLVVGFILLEFLVLVYVVTNSYRTFSFRDMLRTLGHKLAWLSGPQLLIFLAYLFLMIPIGNLGLTSTLLQRFRVPAFIVGELVKSDTGRYLYYGVQALIFYLNIRLIYFLPLSVVNKEAPWTNLRQSWQLTRRNKLRLIITIGLLSLFLFLIGSLIVLGLVFLFARLDSIWDSISLQTLFYSLVNGITYLLVFGIKLVMMEVLITYLIRVDAQSDTSYFSLAEKERQSFRYPRWSRNVLIVIILGFIGYNGLQLYLLTPGQGERSPAMVAHRGDVNSGVENSIEALRGANKAGADLVEMDVVMTADKKFAVIHDNNLKRLAGLDWDVSEENLADLEELTVTQGKFKAKISSLEDYVKEAKALNQPLLIEFKPYGHEPANYAELVVAELKRLNLTASDKVMSMDLKLMEAIEKQAPELTTGYVIPLQFGGFDKRPIDFYVIEDFSYNDLVLLSAQNQKKEIYVWTINDGNSMAGYLQSPVNGIITDELALFKETKEDLQPAQKNDTYMDRVIRLVIRSSSLFGG